MVYRVYFAIIIHQEALGINAAQVYLAKHRVGSLVRKEIQGLENQLL
jgi:RNA polymerase sigma-70 factor (ECF subfamily)